MPQKVPELGNRRKQLERSWSVGLGRHKKAADWVAKNPRKIGNTAGEFIPDVAAAAFSAGGSLALTGAKVAGKEVLEEVGERVVREGLEEATEKAAKEGGEALAKKTGKELVESLGDDAGDIAKVVTRTTVKPKPPFKISNRHIGNKELEDAFKKQLQDQEDAINKMKVRDWLKNREDFLNRDKKDYSNRAKKARDDFRQQEIARKTDEFMQPPHNMNLNDAEKAAQQSMKGKPHYITLMVLQVEK